MNILYIHQYFVTPQEPGGTRSYWIAQELIKRGHQVTMITSSTKYEEPVLLKEVDGIKVCFIKEDYDQNMSVTRRLKSFVRFMYKATRIAFKQKEVDLVIATSTPLTIGVPALMLKWFKRTPYLFEVRDLWPEVPIQMGAIKNPLMIRLTRAFERTIYRNAQHVIALSPGMQNGVVKYIPKERTTMIPNMAKKDEFWPRQKDRALEAELELHPHTFKLVHFGALGLANGAMSIIEAAKLLKGDDRFEFVFIGGGATEPELIAACKSHGLNNVRFLGKHPMATTSAIVNLCDVSIVSFADIPILYTNSPNKLFDSLSAGKPIIVNSAGWTKDLVELNDCGYYVNPHIPEELVTRMIQLAADPQRVQEMGERSRELAENEFDKSILCERFVNVVEQLHKN